MQSRVFSLPRAPAHSYTDYVYFAPGASALVARYKFSPDLAGMKLRFRAQSEGDLGTRLQNACAEVLSRHDLALVWGADIPCLPAGVFDQAIALFPQSVITLARDGGYAFLSLAAEKYSAAAFDRIRWSTSSAGADQIRALQQAGIPVVVRGKVTDLDRAKDFTRILRELEAEERNADLEDLNQTIVSLRGESGG